MTGATNLLGGISATRFVCAIYTVLCLAGLFRFFGLLEVLQTTKRRKNPGIHGI